MCESSPAVVQVELRHPSWGLGDRALVRGPRGGGLGGPRGRQRAGARTSLTGYWSRTCWGARGLGGRLDGGLAGGLDGGLAGGLAGWRRCGLAWLGVTGARLGCRAGLGLGTLLLGHGALLLRVGARMGICKRVDHPSLGPLGPPVTRTTRTTRTTGTTGTPGTPRTTRTTETTETTGTTGTTGTTRTTGTTGTTGTTPH